MENKNRPFFSSSENDSPQLMKQCPLCNTEYDAEKSIQVVEEQEGAELVYFSCLQCANSVLALVGYSPFGVSSIGMLTDLTYDDVNRLRHRDSISEDDILQIHQYLRLHEQDFIHSLMN